MAVSRSAPRNMNVFQSVAPWPPCYILQRCRSNYMFKALTSALVLLASTTIQAAAIFDYGASWTYFLGQSEASSPDTTAWRYNSFSDASWSTGATPIGFATTPNNPTEQSIRTTLPTGSDAGYTSVFFRKPFEVKAAWLPGI